MKLGVDEGAVLDVQTSTVTIGPLEVVVGDLHWSVLEVHVQDVGIYVLLCLAEIASVTSARIKLALKTWFLLPMCCTKKACMTVHIGIAQAVCHWV